MNYKEPLPLAISAFKYHNRRQAAKYFARQIVKSQGERIIDAAPEVLIPIPIHRKKKRIRGYNQAELLARELGNLASEDDSDWEPVQLAQELEEIKGKEELIATLEWIVCNAINGKEN